MKLIYLGLILFSAHVAFANDILHTPPLQLGQYAVGYKEFHACDNSRIEQVEDDPIFHDGPLKDCVRGAAVNGKIMAARPVGFRVWYPTDATTGKIVTYSPNDDIYPNSGVLITALTTASPHGALWNVPVAHKASGFPLVIFSPGSSGTAAELADAFCENLASHGFILAGLDHANDQFMGVTGYDALSLYSYPTHGPFPFTGGGNQVNLISRIHDVQFAINELLRRNTDGTIDENKIGLASYSFGGPTILGVTAGIASQGIKPDPRIKAFFLMDGTLFGKPEGHSSYAFNLQATTSSDLKKITIPIMMLYNSSTPDALRAFQDVGSHDVGMTLFSTAAHISTGLRYCQMLHNIFDHLLTATSFDVFSPQFINLVPFEGDWYQHYVPSFLGFHAVIDAEHPLFDDPLTSQVVNNGQFADDPYQHCDASLFTTHSLTDAQALMFGNPQRGVQPPPLGLNPPQGGTPSIYTMPLQMFQDELINAETFYLVAFFEAKLAGNSQYDQYLSPQYAQHNLPPFFHTRHNEFNVKDHPLDLKSGDKITFKPIDQNRFEVSYSQHNSMLPINHDHVLNIRDDVSINQEIVPFHAGFPFLGTSFGNSTIASPFLTEYYGVPTTINNIDVYNSGVLTLGLDRPLNVLGDIGLPFNTDQVLIGSGVYRIAPFFTHLILSQPNSQVSYRETEDHRLIVTWSNLHRYPFEEDNLNLGRVVVTGPSTFQVILYGNGSSNPGQIDFIYGDVDGKTNSPDRIIAVVGIAKGNAWTHYPIEPIADKMGTAVKFSDLEEHPIILPVGAIFETFTQGIKIHK